MSSNVHELLGIAAPNAASTACLRAASLVGGDRDRTHGSKLRNFNNIAALWSAYLEIRRDRTEPLDATDVANMMVLLKTARTQHGAHNQDDWDDMIGYAACGAQVAVEAADG